MPALTLQTLRSFTKCSFLRPQRHIQMELNKSQCEKSLVIPYSHIHKASATSLHKNFKFLFDCFQGCYNIISKISIYQSWKSWQQCRHSLRKCKASVLVSFLAAQLHFYSCSFTIILVHLHQQECMWFQLAKYFEKQEWRDGLERLGNMLTPQDE